MRKITNKNLAKTINKIYYLFYLIKPLKINGGGHILMFHDIGQEKTNPKEYYLNINDFKSILLKYKKSGYTFISIDEIDLYEDLSNKIVITFDDGYKSTKEYAVPILLKEIVPFCIFVSGEFINKDGYLSSDDLKEISKHKECTIGSHLYNHEMTRYMDKEKLFKNVKRNNELLENITNCKIKHFAFPYGSFFATSIIDAKYLKECFGFKTILSTRIGTITNNKNKNCFLPRLDGSAFFINKYYVFGDKK